VFFFPSVPQEDTPQTEFRTLPETLVVDLPSEVIKLYRKAKLFQIYLGELYEEQKPVEVSLLDTFTLEQPSRLVGIAREIRQTLGLSIREQTSWRSPEIAFKKWRAALEANGIFIFKDAFRNDDYSGFCLYDEKYPLILVNNSMSFSRQVFTLFHELGHLLYHSGGIDFRNSEDVRSFQGYHRRVEVSCNRFAHVFLVPQEEMLSCGLKVSEEHFEAMAEHFSVSREVILRSYLDRGVIEASYYEEMVGKWARQAKARRTVASRRGNSYYTKKAYLGDNYVNLAFSKYYQHKISSDSLSEYLTVKPKHIPTFEHYALGVGMSK
jgi:Zn-dependent peptidase ImmA (M78 family)